MKKIEELRKEYLQKVHSKVERRPCNEDKRLDGKYNYIHQEDAIDIVLELLKRLEELDAHNKTLKQAYDQLHNTCAALQNELDKAEKENKELREEISTSSIQKDFFNKIVVEWGKSIWNIALIKEWFEKHSGENGGYEVNNGYVSLSRQGCFDILSEQSDTMTREERK